MVEVYFDATYNHPRPDSPTPEIHTLAAYVGTKESWKKFRKEWRSELDKKNIDHFHMSKFEFARSQAIAGKDIPKSSLYHGCKADEFAPFLQRLHNTINRKGKDGVYRFEASISAVIKSDFDEALPDELKGDVQCASYYIFNVITVIKGIALWADRHNYNGSIQYIFSAGDGEDGNLEQLFADMWNDPVAKPLFRLSKDYADKPYSIKPMKAEPALQAADIVAYELHKAELEWIARGYVDMPLSELRKSLGSLCRTSHYGWVYNKERLALSFADIVSHNKNRRFRKP